MKNIVLSFDDARKDFYTRAFPLLKQKGVKVTLNVTSGFVLHPEKFTQFCSANNKAMSPGNIIECQNYGIEIALHGSMYLNTKQDVLQNIEELKLMGIDVDNIGFASPCSHITFENKNEDGIWDLINKKNGISYIRSGRQLRREGFVYVLLSLLNRIIRTRCLFRWLNKREIIQDTKIPFFSSVTVYSYTSLNQIKSLIKSMPNDSSIILMFHSILQKSDSGYGIDKWYWEQDRFNDLLDFLCKDRNINICTNRDLLCC